MKKVLWIFGGIVVVLIVGLILFIYSAPSLPPETDAILDEVLQSQIPELITGETGMAKSDDVAIWYESIRPIGSPKAAILLIMGHSGTALAWPEYFYRPLVDAGYQVIRYDNRGLGMSDWMKDWSKDSPYTLEDMAEDGIAVLNALGIERAHIVGISMGGMIGQRMAIHHSSRVLSLTSIMSSGYIEDPELSEVPKRYGREMLRLALRYGIWRTEKDTIRFVVGFLQLLRGDGAYDLDIRLIAESVLYELRKRRGYNMKVGGQHSAAISASGSLYDELDSIKAPTLIIHGRSDPLIAFEHAEKYASLIPNAKTLWIKGMGHDIPRAYTPEILQAMMENFRSGERLSQTRIGLQKSMP